MRFQTEVWEQYAASQNRAKRILRKGKDMKLPVLNDILDRSKMTDIVELGTVNIPVNQIVGVVIDTDRDFYTRDFQPLPSVKSEFAETWTGLYMEHLSDTGLVDPIRCCEYLGKFYVVDGKKRVSVLKAHGTTMVKAEVTRILPEKSDDIQTLSYYEFLRAYEKTGLYQIAFTRPGQTEGFLKALGHAPDHVWNDSDRFSLMFRWYPFERALKVAFDGTLNITTADAMMVLFQKHTYDELCKMPSWNLAELMQESWEDMCRICDPDFSIDAWVA